MRYTFLNVVARYGAQDETNYKMPIMANDELYNRLPEAAGDSVTILSGRQEGYDSITYFFQDVCKALGFNPYKIKDFYINPRGLQTMEKEVIEEFMGEWKQWTRNQSNFFPDSSTNANLMGYTYFADGYSNAQASIGQTPYGSGDRYNLLFCNIMEVNSYFSANDGVRTEFEIWPESVIKTGYINTQHFQINNTTDRLIKTGHVKINIWYNETTELYNFNIILTTGYYDATVSNYVRTKLEGVKTDHVYNPANPLDNKQNEGDEGGNGDVDPFNDPLTKPPVPSLDITSLGGINLYKLNGADFAALISYLSSHAPGESILKWFANPIQGITSCYVLPYPVHVKAAAQDIRVMGITTGTAADLAVPWEDYDLGSVYVPSAFGDTFLDYSPNTRISLFLPFIGTYQLNPDDVIGHNIRIEYQFDNITGGCVAYVSSDEMLRYTYSGSCAIGVPLSQSNWGQTYISAAVSAAKLAGGALAGAQAGMHNAGTFETAGQGYGGSMMKGLGAAAATAGIEAFNAKPFLSRSGACTGSAGALGMNKPYMIIERPDKAKVENPRAVIGLTSGRTLSLGSLSGYNIIEHVHLKNIAATGPELDEIESLLLQGVDFGNGG